MFFFILLNIILFFFCLYFYFEQKKLKQKIIDLEIETKIILERKLVNNKDDLVSIENISIETNENTVKEKNNISNKLKKVIEEKIKDEMPFSKLLKEKYSAKVTKDEYIEPKIEKPTTSTLIENQETNINSSSNLSNLKITAKEPTNVSIEPNFNPSEFIKTEKNEHIINEEIEQDNEYLTEVSKQIAEQLTPQTIELTDYEKAQEEQAVISYQELLSLKERIKNEDKKDSKFIDDLRELRKLLD